MKMECQLDKALLIALSENELTEFQRSEIELHMLSCKNCRLELEQLQQLQQLILKEDTVAPPAALKENFNRMLWAEMHEAYDHRASSWGYRIWDGLKSGYFGKSIAFLCIAVVCFGVGSYVGIQRRTMPLDSLFSIDGSEVVTLKKEVDELRRLYLASAVSSNRPSQRLHAIQTLVAGDDRSMDEGEQQLLLQYILHDKNANVRYMALTQLNGEFENAAVNDGLMQALENETEPMMQLTLIQILSESGNLGLTPILEFLLSNPTTDDLVKSAAAESLRLQRDNQDSNSTINTII